jgi:PelD GGDEF domain
MGVHHDNLRHIWVLVQAYSEYLRTSQLGQDYQPLWPQAPLELRQEFARLANLNRRFGIKSYCVVWRIFSRRAPVIAEHLRQSHRGGELVWMFRAGDELKLVSLFSFADSGHVAVAIERIIENARQRGGLSAEVISKVSTEEISLGLPRAYQLMVDQLTDTSTDSSITWEDSV